MEDFYTGITNNIKERLKKHDHGYKATRSTLNRGPFELMFVQICIDRIEARQLERCLESRTGRELRTELLVTVAQPG